jgi:hypothetical protein
LFTLRDLFRLEVDLDLRLGFDLDLRLGFELRLTEDVDLLRLAEDLDLDRDRGFCVDIEYFFLTGPILFLFIKTR